ncbi:hypothetical protein AKJ09_05445 [Labilithrix luteola]|uniref:Tetratricopeptide repeat protein n=1 Tax=Labilithrix luteola TaxID=1391654 RepID=A0A0K1PZH9_9BACT|nr:hypothetical protein [Labilithrix luteola]AKU98781.1 hypothetical protein AKJ09_05445 [Labilithrix luteola]
MRFVSLVSLASLASLVSLPSPALAQDDSERAAAAFEAGRAALEKGNLVEACTKLAESDRLAPSGRTLLNLGDCYERRGMFASAYTKFLEAAARALRAGKTEAEQHARERAARVEGRVARVSIVVNKHAEVPGLEIRRDGVVLQATAWNTPELVDPGTQHVYEATAPGRAPFSASVTTEPGKTSSVELVWAEAKPSTSEAPPPEPSQRSHVLAFSLLGAGAAGVVVGTIGGLVVLDAKSTVSSHCSSSTHRCDDAGFEATDRGATWSIVSPIAFGVGLAGIGVGAWLLLRDPEKPHSTSWVVTPQWSTTGAGLSLSGRL